MHTTMKLKLTLGALLFAASSIFCGRLSAQDYAQAIPSDAFGVVRLDAARIVELSGADPSALLKGYIEKQIGMTEPLFSVAAILVDIADDPENSGIDVSSPVYFFFLPQDKSVGIAAKVADRNKLEALSADAAKRTDGEIGKAKGVTYVSDPKGRLMFDNRAAVMTWSDSDQKADAKKACAEFAARGKESIVATEGFRRMSQTAGEVALLISGAAIGENNISESTIYKDAPIGDLAFVFSLNSGAGIASAEWRMLASSDEAEKYIERNAATRGPVDGRYADRIPESAAFVSYGAIHGELMVAMLESALGESFGGDNPYRDMMIRALSSLDGDFALYADKPSVTGQKVDFGGALMAAVKNRAIMELLGELVEKNNAPLTEVEGGYALRGAVGDKPSIIERDGTLVVSNDGMNGVQSAEKPMKADVAGCYGYLFVDMKSFTSPDMAVLLGLLDSNGSITALLKRIDTIESIAPTPYGAHGEIRFVDPDDNIYKIVADTAAAVSERCDSTEDAADDAAVELVEEADAE